MDELFQGLRPDAVLVGVLCVAACGQSAKNRSEPDAGSGGSDAGSGAITAGGPTSGGGSSVAGSASGGAGGLVSGGAAALSTGSDAGASNGFADDRPPRPDPELPFVTGVPGWRDSDDFVCVPAQGNPESFDVWADDRGVFVIASSACDMSTLDAKHIPCGQQGVSVQHNPGTGWQTLVEIGPKQTEGLHNRPLRIRGFPQGPLVLAGVLDEVHHGVSLLDDGMLSPQLDARTESDRVFVVGERLYALAVDPENEGLERQTRIMVYQERGWSLLAELPEPVRDLWANETLIAVVGGNQTFFVGDPETGDFQALLRVPAGYYTSVWGFAEDDLWAGNSVGQLVHFDGQGFRVLDTESRADWGIERLWGVNGQLFFTTATEFGRSDGESVELLVGPDPEHPELSPVFTGLWGLSESEVFVSLLAGDYAGYRCSSYFAAWFDGEELHLF